MKYCIVYGSPRKKNTYQAVQMVKNKLEQLEPSEFTEFFLPQDFPVSCTGCFTCFMKGEQLCPHRSYVEPIERAMLEADGFIFASPVYVMELSGVMKNCLDHFGYLFMPHRPRREMFGKSAAVISTTAGAGTKYAIDGICRSLSYWGISRIFRCGITMWAGSFEEMEPKRRARMENALEKTAVRLYQSLKQGAHVSLKTKVKFLMMKQAVLKFAQNPIDQDYWKAQGWAQGETPWKQLKGKKSKC